MRAGGPGFRSASSGRRLGAHGPRRLHVIVVTRVAWSAECLMIVFGIATASDLRIHALLLSSPAKAN